MALAMDDKLIAKEMPDYMGKTINPGDRVKIRQGHNWHGRTGIYKGIERIQATGQWACLVHFDDEIGGDGCYVLKADEWKKLID